MGAYGHRAYVSPTLFCVVKGKQTMPVQGFLGTADCTLLVGVGQGQSNALQVCWNLWDRMGLGRTRVVWVAWNPKMAIWPLIPTCLHSTHGSQTYMPVFPTKCGPSLHGWQITDLCLKSMFVTQSSELENLQNWNQFWGIIISKCEGYTTLYNENPFPRGITGKMILGFPFQGWYQWWCQPQPQRYPPVWVYRVETWWDMNTHACGHCD